MFVKSNRVFSISRAFFAFSVSSLIVAVLTIQLSALQIFGSSPSNSDADTIIVFAVLIFVASVATAALIWPIALKLRTDGLITAVIIGAVIAGSIGFFSYGESTYQMDPYTLEKDADAPFYPRGYRGAIFFGALGLIHATFAWLMTYVGSKRNDNSE